MTTDVVQLNARRAEAIEQSGWGRSFRFVQPRNAAFWTFVAMVGAGVVFWTESLVTEAGNARFGPAIGMAAVLFAVYGGLFWWFTQRIDRYSSIPARLMVLAFMWGGFAATWVMAVHGNNALREIYAKSLGQDFVQNWGPALAAPFTEELSKGVGLLLLIALAPRLINTAYDGFILGAMLGLGFQIVEDIHYAINAATSDFGAHALYSAIKIVALRSAVGFTAHILYSSILCAGLVYLLGRPQQPRRVGLGLLLITIPVVLHMIWDAGAGFASVHVLLTPVSQVATFIVALVIVVRVFKLTVPAERDQMRDVLAPEVATGVLRADELEAVVGDRKARKRFRKDPTTRAERRARKNVIEATFDLAHAIADASGRDTAQVTFARAELARVRAS